MVFPLTHIEDRNFWVKSLDVEKRQRLIPFTKSLGRGSQLPFINTESSKLKISPSCKEVNPDFIFAEDKHNSLLTKSRFTSSTDNLDTTS
jgi:hypothetical protein